jgi:hypothetical protein
MDDSSFYSINKLVEFGMGLAVAQQMVKTMNQSIENMKTPGSFSAHLQQPQALFYAVVEGKQMGPLSEQDVALLIRDKKIVNETYMWKAGMPSWDLAEKIPSVVRLVALTPPPLPPNIEKK